VWSPFPCTPGGNGLFYHSAGPRTLASAHLQYDRFVYPPPRSTNGIRTHDTHTRVTSAPEPLSSPPLAAITVTCRGPGPRGAQEPPPLALGVRASIRRRAHRRGTWVAALPRGKAGHGVRLPAAPTSPSYVVASPAPAGVALREWTAGRIPPGRHPSLRPRCGWRPRGRGSPWCATAYPRACALTRWREASPPFPPSLPPPPRPPSARPCPRANPTRPTTPCSALLGGRGRSGESWMGEVGEWGSGCAGGAGEGGSGVACIRGHPRAAYTRPPRRLPPAWEPRTARHPHRAAAGWRGLLGTPIRPPLQGGPASWPARPPALGGVTRTVKSLATRPSWPVGAGGTRRGAHKDRTPGLAPTGPSNTTGGFFSPPRPGRGLPAWTPSSSGNPPTPPRRREVGATPPPPPPPHPRPPARRLARAIAEATRNPVRPTGRPHRRARRLATAGDVRVRRIATGLW
jgi:hypothetical protein